MKTTHFTLDQKTAFCGADITDDDHRLTHIPGNVSCGPCAETRYAKIPQPAPVKDWPEQLVDALSDMKKTVAARAVTNETLDAAFTITRSVSGRLGAIIESRVGGGGETLGEAERKNLAALLRVAASLLQETP